MKPDLFGKVKELGKYPWKTQKCPICKKPYSTKSIRHHVTAIARREAFDAVMQHEYDAFTVPMPHMQLYKKHTVEARTLNLPGRVWKD